MVLFPFHTKMLWAVLLLLIEGSHAFQYEDCGDPAQNTITIHHLSIDPSPAIIPGELKVGARIEVKEDIPSGSIVKLRIVRRITKWNIDIPLPCLGNVGSCDVEACRFLDGHLDRACPFFPKGQPCQCPIIAGEYQGTDITVPFPDFGPLLNQLVAGSYSFKFEVKHADRQLVCVKVNMELASGG